MSMLYKLQSFEGPLDLLLHLIDKSEIDIYNIPIAEITEQYLSYLHSMQELELDVTSEFLVMAATLLSIKSKLLLPKPPVMDYEMDEYFDDDYDPRAELVQKLVEYRKYKGIAEHLREKELERSLIYSREPEDLSPFIPDIKENPVKGLHVTDLMIAFQRALKKAAAQHSVARIRRDEISVKDRMKDVVNWLRERGGKLLFSKLFAREMGREEIVVTFLALLELMKMKQISCYQNKLFDDIVIHSKANREETEDLDGIDELSTAEIDY
ncbi:segregation and condensation protein A [Paenibacillus swuensis]|uniref:Segregation and condensation protein A n=1 Tax=Paenibacillus swuensis TaxID=1178515 RepID=A0A172TLV5_9BACL|nr:segregation/condensation protein A [Paenibacillus swuensis]ANE48010.1 segregation and condensation protein A [Paenibacillus swuensis]